MKTQDNAIYWHEKIHHPTATLGYLQRLGAGLFFFADGSAS